MALLTGLVSYWKFDENTGTSAADSSGSNTGTLSGAALPTWITGKINSGLNFGGVTSYVNVANAASLQPTAITVNAWVNPTTLTPLYSAIVHKGDGTNYYEYFIKSTGKMAVYLTSSGGAPTMDGSGTAVLSTGVWSMATFTYDSTTGLICYVNGAADGTAAAAGTLTSSTSTLSIGRDGFTAGRYFAGGIDEVGIWNRALTPTEITELYNTSQGKQYPFAGGSLTNVSSMSNLTSMKL